MKLHTFILTVALALACHGLQAANPYLPLWEHIPDGEPYVFEDPDQPGKYRVYIYGSHDNSKTTYCGRDQVVWSAPVDSLDRWRYDGIIFESVFDRDGKYLNDGGQGDVLFAPDVAMRVLPDGSKEYFLYPNVQAEGRGGLIARSNRPDGPFKPSNWSAGDPRKADGILGFDPAVLIDDDGRVYGYWGFGRSYAAELDPVTMSTVKDGTEVVTDLMGSVDDDSQPGHFFEASSIRKIKDKYVFIYSRKTPEGEFGLPRSNYTLAYAYSENPLGPYTYGGTIIDARGRDTDAEGNAIPTATPNGNTHGSIAEINGQWWVFYHRQTGTQEFARQAMVSPITVEVEEGPGGKVRISEAEMTSEGFERNGLDPFRMYPAAIASHFTGPRLSWEEFPTFFYQGPYFEAAYADNPEMADPYDLSVNMNPVVHCTDGSTLGYKYYNFDLLKGHKKPQIELTLVPQGIDGTIEVYTSAPWKKGADGKLPEAVGKMQIKATDPGVETLYTAELEGIDRLRVRQPLYFVFSSPVREQSIATIHYLRFK